jgi:F actin bundling C terminal
VFLKAFVLDFSGQKFEEVLDVASQFQRYITPNSARFDLEEALAHQFLEKRGETVTAAALRDQLKIIDVDNNHRLSFLEYALFKFHKTPADFFTQLKSPERGGGEALRRAIEEYRQVLKKREERERKMEDLATQAAAGGVKGMAAKNQLAQMRDEDQLALNKAEITSAANKRKAEKNAIDPFEEEQKRQAEEKAKREAEEKVKRDDSRQKLAAKAAMFNK